MNSRPGVVAVIIGLWTATGPTFLLWQAVSLLFLVPLTLGLVIIVLGVLAIRSDARYWRHLGWISAILLAMAVIIPCGLILDAERSGYPIVLVIPDGYRGPVRLTIDKKNGVEIPRHDGRYTYPIHQDGTLVIKDASSFYRWHSEMASYASGRSIPRYEEGHAAPDAVWLHDLGSGVRSWGGNREEYILYFLGTDAEVKRFNEER
jgi:hypothetical protein